MGQQLDSAFATDWLATIDLALGFKSDNTVVSEQKGRTGTVQSAMADCKEIYNDILYFAEKAFKTDTGKLDESILFLADFYESELDEATKSMSNFMEPILLLVMGLIVAFVALAIITPIYKITQTLGR